MTQAKTLQEREKELQALIRTPEGRQELEALACLYQSEGGQGRPSRTSVITYILVHERSHGLIAPDVS
jgi:hypothetical protein